MNGKSRELNFHQCQDSAGERSPWVTFSGPTKPGGARDSQYPWLDFVRGSFPACPSQSRVVEVLKNWRPFDLPGSTIAGEILPYDTDHRALVFGAAVTYRIRRHIYYRLSDS